MAVNNAITKRKVASAIFRSKSRDFQQSASFVGMYACHVEFLVEYERRRAII